MIRKPYPPLSDLALIGDRRTAAAIGRDATVYWYCPSRFDGATLFWKLLDPGKGAWRVQITDAVCAGRRYVGDSAVLETELVAPSGRLVVTDWLSAGISAPAGVFCRTFSAPPCDTPILFDAWDMNAGNRLRANAIDGGVDFAERYQLFASQPLQITDQGVQWVLPRGQEGWSVLGVAPRARPTRENIEQWRNETVAKWTELAATKTYEGPYEAQVGASLRQLRMLVFEPTGAIVASATAGLPEVLGGKRNYDYRYAWLRDTAMIVRAMLKSAARSNECEKFVGFVDAAREHATRDPINVVVTVEGRPVPDESNPPLAGYRDSRPVRIGNRATHQLQLGALGNFLLAAAEIYRERGIRDWATTEAIADFLVGHWQEPDSGMWEASKPRQFTASKVFAACGLQAIAPFARGERQEKFRSAAEAIRGYVLSRCLTSAGAFAAFEGFEGVDVSTALYPVWSFCAPDSPEMVATMEIIHRDFERDGLFRRDDQTPEHRCEGAFLPATFWVSQYWATRGDCERARRYIDAGLRHANDLGVFPEEIDWSTKEWLGNIPLGMTHASFLNAVADLSRLERRLAE